MPDTIKRKPEDQTQLFEQVCKVERDVIERRRHFIKDKYGRERTGSPVTGLALSGGGIRSASFGLGVLQALQAKHENHPVYGIEGIDYLSTVSGGGYIGSSLTAALQKTEGKFPFVNVDKPEDYSDTSSVRHIRDYSNYLIPHGALDIVTALGIIGRGIVANWLIVAPVLLFLFGLHFLSIQPSSLCISQSFSSGTLPTPSPN